MILPNKYVSFEDSLIYQSAIFLKIISNKRYTIDLLWNKYNKLNEKSKKISYIYYIYLIEFMYIAGMINYTHGGEIYNENIKTNNFRSK